ncbi:hypothetical protein MMC07_004006 [Pseudocyphellaria aurata]|nr:hypothetical protein [Pseudocyphellaria aurata]
MILHVEEREDGSGLPIVHPSILVLAKLKRWAHISKSTNPPPPQLWAAISKSTYPPSMLKAETDRVDIKFLVKWLGERGLKISVPAYNAAVPGRLYDALKNYEEFLKEMGEAEQLAQFKAVYSLGQCYQ